MYMIRAVLVLLLCAAEPAPTGNNASDELLARNATQGGTEAVRLVLHPWARPSATAFSSPSGEFRLQLSAADVAAALSPSKEDCPDTIWPSVCANRIRERGTYLMIRGETTQWESTLGFWPKACIVADNGISACFGYHTAPLMVIRDAGGNVLREEGPVPLRAVGGDYELPVGVREVIVDWRRDYLLLFVADFEAGPCGRTVPASKWRSYRWSSAELIGEFRVRDALPHDRADSWVDASGALLNDAPLLVVSSHVWVPGEATVHGPGYRWFSDDWVVSVVDLQGTVHWSRRFHDEFGDHLVYHFNLDPELTDNPPIRVDDGACFELQRRYSGAPAENYCARPAEDGKWIVESR